MAVRFATLWDEFSVPLKRFIRKRIPNEQDTEDILQEVFVKIHSNMSGLEDENKIHAWVYQITRNAIVDYCRKKNRAMELAGLAEGLANQPDDALSSNQEIMSCLRAIVNHLPEKYKQAIMLTEFQNLTQRELSEKMGLTLSGAKSRVQRAKSMLRKMLLGCCHLEFDRMGNIIDYAHKTKSCRFC